MNRIRSIVVGFIAVAAAALALGVGVSSGRASTPKGSVPSAASLTVKHTALGDTLTDASGRALYLFQADRSGVSVLPPAGFAVWPAFAGNRRPHAKNGVNAARIGLIAGPAGHHQVTYYGHPLYYYVGDQAPGNTSGQGLNSFGARWYVVSALGHAVTRASTSMSSVTRSGWTY